MSAPDPYRSVAPLRSYRVYAAWGAVAARVFAALLLVGLVVAVVLAPQAHGVGPLALVFVVTLALLFLLRGLGALIVPRGATVDVHRDKIVVPRAWGSPRVFDVAVLVVEVVTQQGERSIVVRGQRVMAPYALPVRITLRDEKHELTLSAALFETRWDAQRLASDIARLKAGRELADHDNPDAKEIFAEAMPRVRELMEQVRSRVEAQPATKNVALHASREDEELRRIEDELREQTDESEPDAKRRRPSR